MEFTASERKRAVAALNYILPILQKYAFNWVITGGFACYAYGVERLLTDIDIDIDTSKDSPEFASLLQDVAPYITQPLEHFIDSNYDNYNFELTYLDQIIDICPMADLLIFNQTSHAYEHFYAHGFPPTETVDFEGIPLILLAKPQIIANKEMLTAKDVWHQRDIAALQAMISAEK